MINPAVFANIGEKGVGLGKVLAVWRISIHAPREGSDRVQSHPSCGQRISIHAPREGSDSHGPHSLSADWHFNPRSP